MIAYLIKMIACSGLLLLAYFLFLEKEKMYRFNRFYLLLSVAFSIIIPAITFQVQKDSPLQTVNELILPPAGVEQEVTSFEKMPEVTKSENQYNLKKILIIVYLSVAAFLLLAFVRNLLKMYSKIKGKKPISYKASKLILIDENLTPHSFLKYIFLNKKAFEKGSIEPEILCHELTHTNQHHTFDVLFIELLIVFSWFNPFVYLYRKAIKLNHEFLADEEVVKRFQNTRAYQYLLISKTSLQNALAVTSQFNFSLTKKRLIMITKNTSPKIAFVKYCLIIAAVTVAVLTFSSKLTAAQENKKQEVTEASLQKSTSESKDSTIPHSKLAKSYATGTKNGVSEELLTEYQNIVDHAKTQNGGHKFSSSEKKRLETIFLQMNLKQQEQQTVVFFKPSKPLPRIVPTEKQFEAFKNPKVYGVWVNEKKIPNNELNNYNPKDFAQVFISKLLGPAKKNKSYSYQVNLMTNDYYQAYYDRAIADKSNTMGFVMKRGPKN